MKPLNETIQNGGGINAVATMPAASMKRFLSLGAGVQSSTLALLIAHGDVPMVDAAIFADTQWEPPAVYQWLDWLEKRLPFPVYRVTQGSLRESVIAKQSGTGGRFASVPWFVENPNGSRGLGRRQCTAEYKIKPLIRKQRELLGYKPRQRIPVGSCETLIGISTDEALRMKPSRERWAQNVWPLIELGMSRRDCLAWMERHGYPMPPRSSCIVCPFHNNAEWRAIKSDPALWADAVTIDQIIREPVRGMRGKQYAHNSCRPLTDVDLSTAEEKGQVNMFVNECEGMCGV